tara:strand:- start:13 stop:198 length:186 start_codon:yes stop_codon:yes gene_type:complete
MFIDTAPHASGAVLGGDVWPNTDELRLRVMIYRAQVILKENRFLIVDPIAYFVLLNIGYVT